MKFELQSVNMTAMKKLSHLLIIITICVFASSCSTTKEIGLADGKTVIDEAIIKQAVESRRFIVKLDRLYTSGGMLDLRPRANYIIVDGRQAIINAAYFGRQYDVRPIAGINMRGIATDYELTSKVPRGMYEIKMKVGSDGSSFDVYLSIGKNGTANASVNSIRIQNARYRGYVVPLSPDTGIPLQKEHGVI